MNLTTAVQEALLALLCYDDKEGTVAAGLLEAKSFDPVYKQIAEQALAYRQQHKQPPGEHTLDVFEAAIEKDEHRKELYERLFRSVQGCKDSINPKFVLGKARDFCQHQLLKRSVASAIRGLEKDDVEGLQEAQSVLLKALKTTSDLFVPGTKMFEDVAASLAFFNDFEPALPTGIPDLDSRNLGPARGTLHLYAAPPKTGKSWWLLNLVKASYQHGVPALYVSLEMSEAQLSKRLTQSFLALSTRKLAEFGVTKFTKGSDPNTWGTEYKQVALRTIPSLQDQGIYSKLVKKMRALADGPRVILRQFPTGTLSCQNLDAYLDLLEQREGFVPGLLVVDYADLMKLPAAEARWEALIDLYINLRRIAVERHIAVATASQVKVSGKTARRVDSQHTAGAWDKVATVDTILTYSQTDQERAHKLARLFVAAARDDEDRFQIVLSQAYEIGQYVVDSIYMGENYDRKDAPG